MNRRRSSFGRHFSTSFACNCRWIGTFAITKPKKWKEINLYQLYQNIFKLKINAKWNRKNWFIDCCCRWCFRGMILISCDVWLACHSMLCRRFFLELTCPHDSTLTNDEFEVRLRISRLESLSKITIGFLRDSTKEWSTKTWPLFGNRTKFSLSLPNKLKEMRLGNQGNRQINLNYKV